MLRKKRKTKAGRLRRVVTGAVALVVALLVAGYAMIASFDVQQVAAFARSEVRAATGRELSIEGPADLQVSLTPSIDLQDVRFANADWGSRDDMVTLRRLEIEVELLPLLFGDVVVRRLVVVEPDILLETNAQGRGNWEFETAAPEDSSDTQSEDGAVTLPDVQAFRIEGGRLVVANAAGGEALQLDVTQAVGAVPAGGGARSLHLEAAYNGNPFTVDLTYGGLQDLLSGAPGPVDLTLEAGGATITAKGPAGNLAAAPRADVAVTASGDSLATLSPFVGSELPALGPYEFSSKVNASAEAIEISGLALRAAESDLGGTATVTLTGERPAVKASLVSQQLDLVGFSAPAGPGAAAGGKARVFSDKPLPLQGLRAVDGQVKLTVDRLRVTPKLALHDVQSSLALKGGRLTVAPFTALLAGGTLDGRLALAGDKAEPELGVALTGQDIDLGHLLTRAGVSEQVGGTLALDVDLLGRGASPHALAAGLGGHVQAVSRDGTIDNALLSAFSTGLSDVTGPLFGNAQNTRLECFVAAFDVEQGQAKSRALVLDTGAFAVSGRGGIDLEREHVSLAFDTETSEPSLASLAVPFKVVGPLADPAVVPDPVGAAVGVVGTAGEVVEGGANIVGGAVDAVGGLVGTGPLIGRIGSDQSLCGAAFAAIEGGGGGSSSTGVADDVGEALEDAGQGIERGLESLFGN